VAAARSWQSPWHSPTFSSVTNLGPTINSSATEWSPSITADGLVLLFASDRVGILGVLDLWVTIRSSIASPFGQPIDLGPMVNSSADYAGADLAPDGTMLLFMCRLRGGPGVLRSVGGAG